MTTCSIENCDTKVFSKSTGWCGKHYNRWRNNGSPYFVQQDHHGMSRSSEYQTWRRMKCRCYVEGYTQYRDYGGRGIKVCAQWRDSFRNFYEDMGERPDGMSLDRVDNDGDYTPENCRWATKQQQFLNRRQPHNTKSPYRGVRKSGKRWIAVVTVNYIPHSVGSFSTAEEAAAAWNKKALELRGPDTMLNEVTHA